ncbi:Fur family transcriptional regulator [Candidatus Bipolaricaulota sp. J31]
MQMLIMNNLRWTRQRRLIASAMKGRTDHPTAEELYHELRDRGEPVSLATVYRTLRALAREGLLREIHGYGPDRFDPNTAPHYHFRCVRCGRVFDVKTPYREELDRVELGPGFSVLGHELNWVGVCGDCEREEGRKEER